MMLECEFAWWLCLMLRLDFFVVILGFENLGRGEFGVAANSNTDWCFFVLFFSLLFEKWSDLQKVSRPWLIRVRHLSYSKKYGLRRRHTSDEHFTSSRQAHPRLCLRLYVLCLITKLRWCRNKKVLTGFFVLFLLIILCLFRFFLVGFVVFFFSFISGGFFLV